MNKLEVGSKLLSIMEKVVPIGIDELGQTPFTLFGSGGYAKKILRSCRANVHAIIDYQEGKYVEGIKTTSIQSAQGDIVIGTGHGNFQYNQICELSLLDHNALNTIYIVDEASQRRRGLQRHYDDIVLLLEHTNGVDRHWQHLQGFRQYFEKQGKMVVSICPLFLPYFKQFHNVSHAFVWGGQRSLYQLIPHYLEQAKLSFLEYGFFPQKDYFYIDKLGVNQHCSLMKDNLDWVEKLHVDKLNLVKSKFLSDFTWVSSDFVLIPLQVPDDDNVVQCSKYQQGMQEFIDDIVNQYGNTQTLIFKPHPKDPLKETYFYHGHKVSHAPFFELLAHAKWVHGITSGALYEAALAGVDVIIEGDSLLKTHLSNKVHLFAAMVDRQSLYNDANLHYVLSNYSHFDTRCLAAAV